MSKPDDSNDWWMFLTASSDGQVLFWDTKFDNKDKKTQAANPNVPDYNVAWKGILSVQLYRPEGGTIGCSNVSFNYRNPDSTRFWATSDEGDLFLADWCAKPSEEQNKIEIIQKIWSSERSGRPTVALDISPFFDDIILTVYDSYFALWKVDCEDPIFISYTIDKGTWITSGFFSPSRPGVIYIGRADGNLDIWDFIDQSSAPTFTHLVVAVGIHSMRINPTKQNLLAVGDRDGYLHMLDLGKNLTRKVANEEAIINDFFNREKDRVNYFKDRFEIRQEQHRKKLEDHENGVDGGPEFKQINRKDDDKTKSDEELLEEQYREFLKEFFEGKKEKDEDKDKDKEKDKKKGR